MRHTRYMMATKAMHKLGDISRETPDLCLIKGTKAGGFYVGEWVEGFGFVGVLFPRATTRPLTDEEHARFSGRLLAIRGCVAEKPIDTRRR